MAVAQSRYARMHKDSHTKPLHDATAQMAVDAQMWQPKRLTRHDAKPTEQARFDAPAPSHFRSLNKWGYTFYVLVGGRTRNLRVVHGCTIVLAPSFARCETNRASTFRQSRPAKLSPTQ